MFILIHANSCFTKTCFKPQDDHFLTTKNHRKRRNYFIFEEKLSILLDMYMSVCSNKVKIGSERKSSDLECIHCGIQKPFTKYLLFSLNDHDVDTTRCAIRGDMRMNLPKVA